MTLPIATGSLTKRNALLMDTDNLLSEPTISKRERGTPLEERNGPSRERVTHFERMSVHLRRTTNQNRNVDDH